MKFKYKLWKIDQPDYEPPYNELIEIYKDPERAWNEKVKLEKQNKDRDVCFEVVVEPLEGGE